MFDHAVLRSIPRAHRDPLRTPLDALLLIMFLLDSDAHDETLVLVLDDERRGMSVLHVTGTTDSNMLLQVVDEVVEASQMSMDAAGLIVVTVQPSNNFGGGVGVDDLAKWYDADATCADAGLDLVEWFIVGNQVSCPRAFCGVAPRWAA